VALYGKVVAVITRSSCPKCGSNFADYELDRDAEDYRSIAKAEQQTLGPDMTDLMAIVGEVLLIWGFLETAMRERLAKIHPKAEQATKAPVLSQWRKAEEQATDGTDPRLAQLFADITEAGSIRNCLAHGLTSASADPWSDVEAAVVCIEQNGNPRHLTISQMSETKHLLQVLTHRVRNLGI
jgi:predicted  nucleic acid-binding Zn-ribbon protein